MLLQIAIACNYLGYINLKIKSKKRKAITQSIVYIQDFMSIVQIQKLVKLEMLKIFGWEGGLRL